MPKSKYNFTLTKPVQKIRHNGHDLVLAEGKRGAELWVEFTSNGLDHKVYNKCFRVIANIQGIGIGPD